ncbi:MAG: succinylglutamate desuccinylase/aspartoacylase family protein, partial [Geminicoccaceae bacterium]
MISTSIDLDAEGIHKGYLDVPLSLNNSAWSNQRVPIVSIKSDKSGPTLLLLGGSHGDEYEGPIVLSNLIHGQLPLEGLHGQLIVMPALNTPAVQQGMRLSPLDGGNMNRAFPGDPHGTMTERLAYFVTTQLIPRSDVVIDLHSGGKSLAFFPCTIVPQQKTEAATARIVALAGAFNAPMTVILNEPEIATMIDTQVEAQSKTMLATELGGGGTVTPE